MAEVVQHELESMVEELDDYRRRGLFTEAEIRSIVKKRTAFEYALKRRQPDKEDFLRYIEYEFNLDLLRVQRRTRLNIRGGKDAGNYSIIKRIHFIFQRALRKFYGDVPLWFEYIKFCQRSGSVRQLGRTFARALQLHPHNEQLWIAAADWELTDNANVTASRVMLQRALRLLPESRTLWCEYLRLECLHLHKSRLRQLVMGVDLSSKGAEKTAEEDEPRVDHSEKDLAVYDDDDDTVVGSRTQPVGVQVLPDLTETNDSHADLENSVAATLPTSKQQSVKALKHNAVKQFMDGALLRVVINAAIRERPNDLEIRERMLSIVSEFPQNEKVASELIEGIARDLATSDDRAALIVAIGARLPTHPLPVDHTAALVTNILAVSISRKSSEFDALAIESLGSLLPSSREADSDENLLDQTQRTSTPAKGGKKTASKGVVPSLQTSRTGHLLHGLKGLFDNALQGSRMTERVARSYIGAAISVRELDAAVLAGKAAVAMLLKQESVWVLYLQALLEKYERYTNEVARTFEDAITALGINHCSRVWQLRLKAMTADTVPAIPVADVSKVFDDLIGALSEEVKLAYLSWCLNARDPAEASRIARKLCEWRPVPLSVYLKTLEIELSTVSTDAAHASRVRRVFERAVSDFGKQSADLWLSYWRWEQEQSDVKATERASQIHWRAVKTLDNPAQFTTAVSIA